MLFPTKTDIGLESSILKMVETGEDVLFLETQPGHDSSRENSEQSHCTGRHFQVFHSFFILINSVITRIFQDRSQTVPTSPDSLLCKSHVDAHSSHEAHKNTQTPASLFLILSSPHLSE